MQLTLWFQIQISDVPGENIVCDYSNAANAKLLRVIIVRSSAVR